MIELYYWPTPKEAEAKTVRTVESRCGNALKTGMRVSLNGMAEAPKLTTRVRSPSPAPTQFRAPSLPSASGGGLGWGLGHR